MYYLHHQYVLKVSDCCLRKVSQRILYILWYIPSLNIHQFSHFQIYSLLLHIYSMWKITLVCLPPPACSPGCESTMCASPKSPSVCLPVLLHLAPVPPPLFLDYHRHSSCDEGAPRMVVVVSAASSSWSPRRCQKSCSFFVFSTRASERASDWLVNFRLFVIYLFDLLFVWRTLLNCYSLGRSVSRASISWDVTHGTFFFFLMRMNVFWSHETSYYEVPVRLFSWDAPFTGLLRISWDSHETPMRSSNEF